jgi:hemerythrin
MPGNCSEVRSALSSLRNNAFNIQSLLRMAQDGKSANEILTKITHAIENHFDRVEKLQIEIPEENLEEHRQILKHFKIMQADWLSGTISDADYAEALNLKLFSHFSSCFQPLLDALLDEVPTLQFRI